MESPDAANLRSELLVAGDLIHAGADPTKILRERVPWLVAHISVDVAAGRFSQWATSTVVDEALQAPVIHQPLFTHLHELAHLDARWPVGNAGLVHVYGYLLSAAHTRHGLKRERWLGSQMATALGLEPDHFVPGLNAGSTPLERVVAAALPLLANPTEQPGLLFCAEEGDNGEPPPMGEPAHWPAWSGERIARGRAVADERVPSSGAAMRTVVVQRAGSFDGVLVYGSVSANAVRIVTMFPIANISPQWRNEFLATPPRLRYNAAGEGIPARSPLVWRSVIG
jgi:hypothetical protein